MDNRGYERDPAFIGYSTRPPPPIVYTVDSGDPYVYEDRRAYRKRRRRPSSEDTSSYSSRGRNVEEAPDGGIRAWLTVLACAVLHLCAELVYFVFYDTIVISRFRNLRLAIPDGAIDDTYDEFQVFEDVSYTGAIVAAVISVYLGYRVVGVLGGICIFTGFLAAAIIDNPQDHWEWYGFLVGFLGGLGVSFWRFTANVAIMEYFVRHRMIAIILAGFGRAAGTFAGYGILSTHFKVSLDADSTKDDITSLHRWTIFFYCQLVMAGVGVIASLVIKPLSLELGGRRLGCAWMLRIRDTHVCRGGMLLLLLAVYYIYYLGLTLPMTDLIYHMVASSFSTTHVLIAIFLYACGITLGYILLAFWPKKKKMYGSLLWMGLLALIMGLITLQVPILRNHYISYLATFTAIFGACSTMFEAILRHVIPIAFGRQYIRWIEGLLGLMAGGATIANNYIARELRTMDPDGLCAGNGLLYKTTLMYKEFTMKYYCNDYYFAGAAFVTAGVLAVVVINILICCKFRDRNYEREALADKIALEEVPRQPLRQSRRDMSASRRYDYQYR